MKKILHVHNVAGVACIIAKFMDRMFNTQSLVVMRKIFDKYGLMTYGEAWNCRAKVFEFRSIWLARKFNIIHIHDADEIIPWFRFFYPNKPIVLHYHGTKIRNKWKERKHFWRKVDAILVSTPDLLEGAPKSAIYIPNPIDTDLFYRFPEYHRQPNSAFAFHYHLDRKKAEKYAYKYGLKLTFLERNIPHSKMPYLFNQYEYYIDRTEIPSLSNCTRSLSMRM